MQSVIVDIVILGLLVFLFGAVSRVRPDDRLRCWVAGWICMLARFAVDLWKPSSAVWVHVQTSIDVDVRALAGICFVVSSIILIHGRRKGILFGSLLAVATVPCLTVAVFGPKNLWPLFILITVRQIFALVMAVWERSKRPAFEFLAISTILASSIWMVYGLLHGNQEIVLLALLTEIYFVAAVDFWANELKRTLALNTVVFGLAACAASFPLWLLIHNLWPLADVYREIWNIPRICLAIGMILVVLEEDTRAAHALTGEYRLLFEANPLPLWIFENATLQFVSVNKAALEMFGYAREEFLDLQVSDVVSPELMPQVVEKVTASPSGHFRAVQLIRKDGSAVNVDVDAHNIVFQGKQCRFVMGNDVTERTLLEQQLEHHARHDLLTGLPNRAIFQQRLTEAVSSAIKSNEKLAILCIDLHRFKRINDTYGVRIGDQCLQRVAGILASRIRLMDIAARTGGEEFAIVLTGIKGAANAEQVASDLREVFAQPIPVQGYKIQLAFSIGLAVCPDDGTDALALWRGAESALRQAQAAGGGQTVWLSPELSDAADEEIELEAYMRTQLESGGFRLHYQPVYGFDGAVHSLEALLRLHHPRQGELSPAKFIRIAEETGLIVAMGEWVNEEVCQQLQAWKDEGQPLVPVAVNVSGMQLMHVDFASRLMATLERHDVDPCWIQLEVTESAAMHDVKRVAKQMAVLTEQGIKFSIDDFGTGHSSLGRLHNLPISTLKIDRSFIDRLSVHGGTFSIVQAIISMAHALGHEVVAEGVETEDQLAILRRLHCDFLQGFLLSRPAAPCRIPALIAAGHAAITQFGSGSPAIGPGRSEPEGFRRQWGTGIR